MVVQSVLRFLEHDAKYDVVGKFMQAIHMSYVEDLLVSSSERGFLFELVVAHSLLENGKEFLMHAASLEKDANSKQLLTAAANEFECKPERVAKRDFTDGLNEALKQYGELGVFAFFPEQTSGPDLVVVTKSALFLVGVKNLAKVYSEDMRKNVKTTDWRWLFTKKNKEYEICAKVADDNINPQATRKRATAMKTLKEFLKKKAKVVIRLHVMFSTIVAEDKQHDMLSPVKLIEQPKGHYDFRRFPTVPEVMICASPNNVSICEALFSKLRYNALVSHLME